jgi:flagellar M-ring protein FliF
VSSTTSKETYTGSGASPTGTLGSTGTSASGNKSGKYSQSSTTVNNALGTQRERVTTAVGQLKNVSIAVALDSNVKNLNVGAITSLVKSAAGYNAARGDSLAVQSLPFSKTGQLAPGAATTTASSSPSPLMGYIKQGVLALLVLGVLVAAFVASKRKTRTAPPANDDVVPFPEDEYDAEEAAARAANVTQLRAVADRRRALATAVDERPADVARVLSSWLNTKETGS